MSVYHLYLNYERRLKKDFEWKISDFSKRKHKDINSIITHAVNTNHPRLKKIHKNYYPEARQKLITNLLNDSEVFESINDFKSVLAWIIKNLPERGIKDLGIYDTAFLLCQYKQIDPDHVYLGIGSKTGAKHLFGEDNFKSVKHSYEGIIDYIPIEFFPEYLQKLGTYHIENFLCNYSTELKLYSNSSRSELLNNNPKN